MLCYSLLRGQSITVGFPGRKARRKRIVSQRLAVLCPAMRRYKKQRGLLPLGSIPGRLIRVERNESTCVGKQHQATRPIHHGGLAGSFDPDAKNRMKGLCAEAEIRDKQRGQFIKVNLPGRLTLVS